MLPSFIFYQENVEVFKYANFSKAVLGKYCNIYMFEQGTCESYSGRCSTAMEEQQPSQERQGIQVSDVDQTFYSPFFIITAVMQETRL